MSMSSENVETPVGGKGTNPDGPDVNSVGLDTTGAAVAGGGGVVAKEKLVEAEMVETEVETTQEDKSGPQEGDHEHNEGKNHLSRIH